MEISERIARELVDHFSDGDEGNEVHLYTCLNDPSEENRTLLAAWLATVIDRRLAALQSDDAAFHRGVDAAKDAIRFEADSLSHGETGYWAALFINAIARKCGFDRAAQPVAGEAQPDQYCVALNNGECVSNDPRCMHNTQQITPEQIVYNVAQRDIGFRKHLIEQLQAMGDEPDYGEFRTLPATDDEPLDAELAEAQRLFERTTQGEWKLVGGDYAYTGLDYAFDPQEGGDAAAEQARRNERWAVAAHNLWPRLVARVQERNQQRDSPSTSSPTVSAGRGTHSI